MMWNPGKQYEMEGVKRCSSLTVTAAGEVVVWVWAESKKHFWVETWSDTHEARWYDQQGKLIQTLPRPTQCEHWHLRILAVEVGGKQQVALSCDECQCIWLGTRGTEEWSVAWQATGEEGSEERKGQPKPYTMCQGKPGQIIAWNRQGDEKSVSVFDITQIPFRVVVPEMKLGMWAVNLCYCELPGVGGALAVTDGWAENKLCMFSLDRGGSLWSVGGKDEVGQWVKVAGAEWSPWGVCSDNRGRLYVADCQRGNNRIIVLSAASGSVLQVVQGRGHWADHPWSLFGWVSDPGVTVYRPDIKYKDDEPKDEVVSGTVLQEFKHQRQGEPNPLCWHEPSKSIVYHYLVSHSSQEHCITYFHVKY